MISVECSGSFCGVYAMNPILKGEIVHDLLPSLACEEPTRTSIQIGEGVHVEDRIGKYINHSCYPSCEIKDAKVISLRDIETRQEITFDYNKSEDIIASPFKCNCCDKLITGRKENE
tara:strand:- start:592 stop:942 length:351 start_codon:yes stop_codon:yes gene_type:complete